MFNKLKKETKKIEHCLENKYNGTSALLIQQAQKLRKTEFELGFETRPFLSFYLLRVPRSGNV